LLLEEEKLLDTALDIVSSVRPGVSSVVLVRVSIGIRQNHLASRLDIGKGVENVGQLLSRDILRLEVAAINALMMFVSLIQW
jgi:hypothetical protein